MVDRNLGLRRFEFRQLRQDDIFYLAAVFRCRFFLRGREVQLRSDVCNDGIGYFCVVSAFYADHECEENYGNGEDESYGFQAHAISRQVEYVKYE